MQCNKTGREKELGGKICSFVYTHAHTRAHTHTHACTHTEPPYTQLFFQSIFHLSSLVVFMFAELPVFPNVTPLFLAFKFLLQLMRTGREGGMFIAGKQLGNSE